MKNVFVKMKKILKSLFKLQISINEKISELEGRLDEIIQNIVQRDKEIEIRKRC